MPPSATKPLSPKSISSQKRLEQMLLETEAELERLQPQIDRIERQIERLRDLKFTKRKLIALRLSLQSILENYGSAQAQAFLAEGHASWVPSEVESPVLSDPRPRRVAGFEPLADDASRVFLPDQALAEAAKVLRKPTSLNFEIFRALVFHGGQATSAQIRQSLIERGITLPTTGQALAQASLSDISSRANYLVRKGLAQADGRGAFRCSVGWACSQPAVSAPDAMWQETSATAEAPEPTLAE